VANRNMFFIENFGICKSPINDSFSTIVAKLIIINQY